MFDLATLIWISVFSLFGLAYFVYGKKAGDFVFLGAGLALMVYPYFISGISMIVLVGVALTVAPFVHHRLNG